jgi:photosystem II cytochrome c550
MLKKLFWLAVVTVVFTFQALVPSVSATELTKEIRTVALNPGGDTITLSLKQVKEGKRLFNYACAQCHAGGVTKTDPNVSLAPEDLELATPKRNSVESLVDYMHVPTSFDGAVEIAEAHPSLKSKDIFPVMRNLTDEDLVAIAGHVLMQPKVVGTKWGGGKIYY